MEAMYFLSKDCFVCKIGCYWIILSIGRDRYLCVAHADLASIGSHLHGWQDQDGLLPTSLPPGVDVNSTIESLISSGIITSNSSFGKSFYEPGYPALERQMKAVEQTAAAKAAFFGAVRFLLACVTADWQLRTQALSRTLARIERRRLRAEPFARMCDADCASKLVGAFKLLRPLYPRPYLCLFDSLALCEFLAGYRLFPQVVFGVVADPFQAHCWLQDGSTVVNDDTERVSRYKPILSV